MQFCVPLNISGELFDKAKADCCAGKQFYIYIEKPRGDLECGSAQPGLFYLPYCRNLFSMIETID
jgi:hypothetical protein